MPSGTVPVSVPGPVDTPAPPPHRAPVSKKPRKVEEPQAPYAAKKPAKAVAASAPVDQAPPIRYVDREAARKLTKDILDKRTDLFRKLAQ